MVVAWFKNLFKDKKTKDLDTVWNDLVAGDLIRVYLKDPKTVGIVSTTQSLTYQRLDAEDLERLCIEGFVIGTKRHGTKPQNIDLLELNVIKKKGTQTKLVEYLLLREEIQNITHITG